MTFDQKVLPFLAVSTVVVALSVSSAAEVIMEHELPEGFSPELRMLPAITFEPPAADAVLSAKAEAAIASNDVNTLSAMLVSPDWNTQMEAIVALGRLTERESEGRGRLRTYIADQEIPRTESGVTGLLRKAALTAAKRSLAQLYPTQEGSGANAQKFAKLGSELQTPHGPSSPLAVQSPKPGAFGDEGWGKWLVAGFALIQAGVLLWLVKKRRKS